MLRMVYPSQSELLKSILNDLPVAGHIASALASPRSKDLCIVASALQLVHLILDKLPELYAPLFRREGKQYDFVVLCFFFYVWIFLFRCGSRGGKTSQNKA